MGHVAVESAKQLKLVNHPSNHGRPFSLLQNVQTVSRAHSAPCSTCTEPPHRSKANVARSSPLASLTAGVKKLFLPFPTRHHGVIMYSFTLPLRHPPSKKSRKSPRIRRLEREMATETYISSEINGTR
jgi:hypothetical protein